MDDKDKRIRRLEDMVDHLTQQKKRLLKQVKELRNYIRRSLIK